MKKLIHQNFVSFRLPSFIFGLFLFFSSCSRTVYQVSKFDSDNVKSTKSDFFYEDSVVKISYDFWSNGGNLSFIIENKTKEILYVLWNKSSLSFNKEVIPYDTTSGSAEWIILETQKNYSPFSFNQKFKRSKKYPKRNSVSPQAVDTATYIQLSNKLCFQIGNDTTLHKTDNRFALSESNYFTYKALNHLPDSTLKKSFYTSRVLNQKSQAIISTAGTVIFFVLLGLISEQ